MPNWMSQPLCLSLFQRSEILCSLAYLMHNTINRNSHHDKQNDRDSDTSKQPFIQTLALHGYIFPLSQQARCIIVLNPLADSDVILSCPQVGYIFHLNPIRSTSNLTGCHRLALAAASESYRSQFFTGYKPLLA